MVMKLPASTQRALAALDEPPAPAAASHAGSASAPGSAAAPAAAVSRAASASASASTSTSTSTSTSSTAAASPRPTPLRLHFVGPPHTTVIRPGTAVAPRQCQKQPVLAIPVSAMLRLPPSVRFLALCLALGPSGRAPSLHGVRADLLPVIHQDDERWIPLLHENGRWSAADDPAHKDVIDFLAPVPPGPAAHRFVWLVWIQPDGVSAHDVLRATGLRSRGDDGGGGDGGDDDPDGGVAGDRARFDDERFEKELGLGDVVAANYFTCEPETPPPGIHL